MQEARAAGLRRFKTPSLEAVERRRQQLWSLMFALLVSLAAMLVVLSFWEEALPDSLENVAQMPVLRACFLGVTAAFCVYVLEKERHLRKITRALVDERVLNSALSNRVNELSVLSEIGRAINSVQDTSSVLEVILDSALALLQASEGAIMLLDTERHLLTTVCARVPQDDAAPHDPASHTIPSEVLVGEGVAGLVAQQGTPLLVSRRSDPATFSRMVSPHTRIESAMGVPLVHRDELLGVIVVHETAGETHFNEYDLHALGLFAENAAVTISNARLFQAEREHVAQLQEVDRQRSEFVATVSHELRSPLTSIMGSVRTLRKRGDTMTPEQSGEFLLVIERQSQRLLKLIDEILFASRIEAGENRLCEEPVDLVVCVGEVVKAFQGREHGARVQLLAPPTASVVACGDPNAVQQVVTNLVDNALKYSGESPVTVSISTAGQEAAVTVSDRGPGIAKDELPHIFERFRQGSDGQAQRGVGLGLYITANLVSGMNGRIWVQSDVGKGAAFTFTLPIHREGPVSADDWVSDREVAIPSAPA
ncbi:MAG: GAF domain-containing sensor histidine kinase [Acidimicrobiia bacterium]|nr:GAF domain-containing sensor histidine kinase [Acidimicrobiia bacterium]